MSTGSDSFLKIVEGMIKAKDALKMLSAPLKVYKIEELGVLKNLKMTKVESLTCGEVGYFISNIRSAADVSIGDTVVNAKDALSAPLPGFRKLKPLVFAVCIR